MNIGDKYRPQAEQENYSVGEMKQEGPYLPRSQIAQNNGIGSHLWKESINLENITNEFLDSHVTGEVMNLDDFLKELQVNELVQQTEDEARCAPCPTPTIVARSSCNTPAIQDRLDETDRYNMIRPANIDNLKEELPVQPTRPSIMHHVGKPPDLHVLQSSHGGHPMQEHMPNPVSLPHNIQQKENNIPHASVRPLVRPVIMATGSGEHQGKQGQPKPGQTSKEIKGESKSRQRDRSRSLTLSEQDNNNDDSDDDSDDDYTKHGGMHDGMNGYIPNNIGVNFSNDDLRLATIPGQDFDPATRRFSEEELKPQPIIRKRKKQFVPDDMKNNKYWAKRCKNNEAAKRSREARRLKENQIAMRARFLEEENNGLKSEVNDLKKENGDLKQMMLALEEKINHMVVNR